MTISSDVENKENEKLWVLSFIIMRKVFFMRFWKKIKQLNNPHNLVVRVI